MYWYVLCGTWCRGWLLKISTGGTYVNWGKPKFDTQPKQQLPIQPDSTMHYVIHHRTSRLTLALTIKFATWKSCEGSAICIWVDMPYTKHVSPIPYSTGLHNRHTIPMHATINFVIMTLLPLLSSTELLMKLKSTVEEREHDTMQALCSALSDQWLLMFILSLQYDCTV